MRFNLHLCAFACFILLPAMAAAQNNQQLRGLSGSTPNNLPSARQQLNQNLTNQQTGFSTRQQIDSANKLNRTEQINRQNTRPGTAANPCAEANASCQAD